MDISQTIQYLFSGITLGSIYAVVAVGFNLIYSTTGILNFAQGEFVMLGAMSAVTFSRYLPLPLAVAGAVVLVAGIGAGLEVAFFRRLRNPTPLRMIIITIGLSILIREAALHVWDEKVRSLPYFTGDACSSVTVFGAGISPQVFWVLGAAAFCVLLLHAVLHRTQVGRAMRACASNPEAAMLAGIHIGRMRTIAFMLSAAIGAVGGCVMCPITMTQYDAGTSLAIKGFAAAILGGLGRPLPGVAGGLLVGLAEAFSVELGMPAAYKDATTFAILVLVLFLRPQGIFPGRQAHREEITW